jgi:hypothetical protein
VRPLDHHKKEDPALVPTAYPAHAPALDAVAQGCWLGEPQEASLNFHSHLCMTRLGGTVKAMLVSKQRNCFALGYSRFVKPSRVVEETTCSAGISLADCNGSKPAPCRQIQGTKPQPTC